MPGFTITKLIAAPPEIVFEALTDHRGYEEIFPLTKVEMEREGTNHPNGVGAVRVFLIGGMSRGLREEVLEYEAPTRFVYKIVSNVPMLRSHRGEVTVSRAPGGSKLEYRTQVEVAAAPKFAVKAGLRAGILAIIRGVRRKAEQRAQSAAA